MNIYLDCGFYKGIALRNYIADGIVDESWKIYAFECSPTVNAREAANLLPMKITLSKRAVWIKNGEIPFWISNRDNAHHIDGTTGNAEKEQILVPAINFSKFVSKLPEAYIFCNMDIEGSEFMVLEKMIKDGTAFKINRLDVEFHHRFMLDKDATDSQELIDKLEALGVEVNLLVPLN